LAAILACFELFTYLTLNTTFNENMGRCNDDKIGRFFFEIYLKIGAIGTYLNQASFPVLNTKVVIIV